ncbi:C2 domain containing [Pyrenophora seminiperda CCB06]|uniref:C2 domain containing n=1 Tax=Pyrenophora seminiperda CCB06 TaxID=1302712 RepID=A0A3M7MHB2_9PLEO|nr:C2 domain containing [Pyrenophora seminiperda CCB06]
MAAMKEEQRERKKQEGQAVVYTQISRTSSMSSSDVEELDRLEQEGEMSPRHLRHQIQREANARVDALKLHAKDSRPRSKREDGGRGGDVDDGTGASSSSPAANTAAKAQ